MCQAAVGNDAEFFIEGTQIVQTVLAEAFGHGNVKAAVHRLALVHREALFHSFSADRGNHFGSLMRKLPMRIAEIIERRAVVIRQIFFAAAGRDKSVLINVHIPAVIGAFDGARSAVQRGVCRVGTDGFVLPCSRSGANETNTPCAAAVPETGNGILSVVSVQQQIERNVAEGIGIGLFALELQLDRTPRLGGERLLRFAGKQRFAARLPGGIAGLCLLDSGLVGKRDELQHMSQQIAEHASQFFRVQHDVSRFARRVCGSGGHTRRSRAQQKDGRQEKCGRSFHFHSLLFP